MTQTLLGERPRRTGEEVSVEICRLMQAVEQDTPACIAAALEEVRKNADALGLPSHFLACTLEAVKLGDWSFFPQAFKEIGFIGTEGDFLLVAPYAISREKKREVRWSALYGQRLELGLIPDTLPILLHLFGEMRQEISPIIPIRAYAGAGSLCGQAGEAFIVPNSWPEMKSGDGPAINNMTEQSIRVGVCAKDVIRRIFVPDSAEFILSVYATQAKQWNISHKEYVFHESGHSSGWGLIHKLSSGVLDSPWMGAVEEFRSDGVAFELTQRTLSATTVGMLIASNMITRFGIDTQRRGGMDTDTDVNCALLTFYFLLKSGILKVAKGGGLSLEECTFETLVQATEPMRQFAVELTRAELQLRHPAEIKALTEAITVPDQVRQIFARTVVGRAQGIYKELR
jgi:Family of unknown function (DUF6014)